MGAGAISWSTMVFLTTALTAAPGKTLSRRRYQCQNTWGKIRYLARHVGLGGSLLPCYPEPYKAAPVIRLLLPLGWQDLVCEA